MYVLLYSSDRNVDEPIVYLPRPMPASMHITSEHFWHTWTIRYTIIHIHGSYHHNTTYECHEILLKALPAPMLFALNCASLRSGHSKLLKVSGQHRINLEGLDSEILAYQKIRQCLKGLQFVSEYPTIFYTLNPLSGLLSHTENRVSGLWPFQGNLVPHEPRTSPAGWPSARSSQAHGAISYLVIFVYATSKKNQAPQAAIYFHWQVEFHVRRSIKLQGNAWRPPRTSQSHAYCYRRHKRKNSQRKKYQGAIVICGNPRGSNPRSKMMSMPNSMNCGPWIITNTTCSGGVQCKAALLKSHQAGRRFLL